MPRGAFLLLLFALCALFATQSLVSAERITARASHILVETEAEADKLASYLDSAAPEELLEAFGQLAKTNSKCPSGRRQGDLGKFMPGQMVPEFDAVVFHKPLGMVHKTKTQFGWHLILIQEREGVDEDAINAAFAKEKEGDAQDEL